MNTEATAIYANIFAEDTQAICSRQNAREVFNNDLGSDPNDGTTYLRYNELRQQAYCDGTLLDFPHYGRLVWDTETNKIKVSYFRNIEDTKRDRRTVSGKVAALLAEFSYPSLKMRFDYDADKLRRYWQAHIDNAQTEVIGVVGAVPLTVIAAPTLESVRDAYRADLTNRGTGGTSCMNIQRKDSLHHKRAGQTVYPCDAFFGAIGCGIYLIYDGETLVGRFVGTHDTKMFYTVYTTSEAMYRRTVRQLCRDGWTQDNEMFGRDKRYKLRLIETDDGGLLMPYIDAVADRMDDTTGALHPIDGNSCDHRWGTMDGYSNRVTCDDCGDRVAEDEVVYTVNDNCICDNCRDRNYTFAFTGRYQGWVPDCDVVGCYNGDSYTSDGAAYHNMVTTLNGEFVEGDDAVYVEDLDDYILCDDARECAVTGEYFGDDPVTVEGLEDVTISRAGAECIASPSAGQVWKLDALELVADGTLSPEEALARILREMNDTYPVNEDRLLELLEEAQPDSEDSEAA